MMETTFKKPLSGIIPPLVTPLKDNETLDIESLEHLIEHLIEGGVHGLFVLGTTGEEQSLSYDVRKQMIKESCRINRGRLPLLACITDTSPYIISNTYQWNLFVNNVNNGRTYDGEFLQLAADIEVSTMAGSNETNSFQGTFDGDGHKLTVSYNTSSGHPE